MTRYVLALAAAVGLAAVAAAEPLKPAVEVRMVAAVDLVPVIEYGGEVFGQPEVGKQFAGILKTLGENEKGFEGLDLKRAVGAYAVLSEKVEESTVVLMIPATDPEAVVGALKGKLGLDPKEKDGVYSLDVPNIPFTIYFRFADDYLYATLRSADGVEKGKLISPKTFFADKTGGILSAAVHFDRVPEDLRKAVYGQLELQLKERAKNETDPTQKRVSEFLIDAGVDAVKTLLTDGQTLAVSFDIDPKADELKLALTMTPKANTTLGKTLASFADRESVAAAVAAVKDPIFAVGVNFALPPETKKKFATLAEGLMADAAASTKGDDKELVKQVTDAILPTLQGGDAQFGLAISDAGKGKIGLTTALKTVDGKGIEAAVKKMATKVPKDQGEFTADADKAGERSVHKVKLAKPGESFASDTFWLLTGDDLLALQTGDSAAGVKAVAAAKGAKAPMLAFEMSWVRFSRLVQSAGEETVKNVVNSVFESDKTNGLDTLKITATGGKQLTVNVAMKGKAVAFLAAMSKAK